MGRTDKTKIIVVIRNFPTAQNPNYFVIQHEINKTLMLLVMVLMTTMIMMIVTLIRIRIQSLKLKKKSMVTTKGQLFVGTSLHRNSRLRHLVSSASFVATTKHRLQYNMHLKTIYIKLTPWPQSASELYRQSGRRRSAKLVPTFADRGVSRGQRNGSPRSFNLCFLDRSRYFLFEQLLN